MGWLADLKNFLPFTFTHSATTERKTLVRLNKVNLFALEVCKPKGLIRERSFGRTEKVDFYHLRDDGTIEHTPG